MSAQEHPQPISAQDDAQPVDGPASQGLRRPSHGQGLIKPPWTAEQAAEAGRKSAAAKKGKPYSLRQRFRWAMRKKVGDDISRTIGDEVIDAMVTKAKGGDVAAVKLILDCFPLPVSTKRTVETKTSRTLVAPVGDPRGRIEQTVTERVTRGAADSTECVTGSQDEQGQLNEAPSGYPHTPDAQSVKDE